MSGKIRTVLPLVGGILVLDQITKALVVRALDVHESVPIIESFFHLTLVYNTGAAFGLLAHTPAWFRQPFFLLATGVAVFALLLFLRRTDEADRPTVLSIAAIIGGAVGNLIDRLRYGHVIDFLDFHWRGYHWPAFNVADTCITLGVIGILWVSLWDGRARA
ncbi:MAG: signal peptidase II [Thermodesulfobacteriota bacterium]|jgi:signal peptidase II